MNNSTKKKIIRKLEKLAATEVKKRLQLGGFFKGKNRQRGGVFKGKRRQRGGGFLSGILNQLGLGQQRGGVIMPSRRMQHRYKQNEQYLMF